MACLQEYIQTRSLEQKAGLLTTPSHVYSFKAFSHIIFNAARNISLICMNNFN